MQAQLYALGSDPDTFLSEPHPDDQAEYQAWKCDLDKRQGEISDLMVNNPNIRKNYSTLVPEKVWLICYYFHILCNTCIQGVSCWNVFCGLWKPSVTKLHLHFVMIFVYSTSLITILILCFYENIFKRTLFDPNFKFLKEFFKPCFSSKIFIKSKHRYQNVLKLAV